MSIELAVCILLARKEVNVNGGNALRMSLLGREILSDWGGGGTCNDI